MSDAVLVFNKKEVIGSWVAEQVGQLASWGDFYAMGAEREGQPVCGVVFNNMTDSNATAHIAVSRPAKVFSELLDHAFSYAFGQLKLRRLTVFVEAQNTKSLKITSHIGFVDEGVMRNAGTGGQDVVIRVLWPENYRKGTRDG